jgi:hypothetical protein
MESLKSRKQSAWKQICLNVFQHILGFIAVEDRLKMGYKWILPRIALHPSRYHIPLRFDNIHVVFVYKTRYLQIAFSTTPDHELIKRGYKLINIRIYYTLTDTTSIIKTIVPQKNMWYDISFNGKITSHDTATRDTIYY